MQSLIINFSIPRQLLETVDNLAEVEMKTRSELLRDAIRDYLEKKLTLKDRWEKIFTYGKKKTKSLKIKPGLVEELVDEYRKGR